MLEYVVVVLEGGVLWRSLEYRGFSHNPKMTSKLPVSKHSLNHFTLRFSFEPCTPFQVSRKTIPSQDCCSLLFFHPVLAEILSRPGPPNQIYSIRPKAPAIELCDLQTETLSLSSV